MPAPGQTIDRFLIEEHVGQGGMASVFRVRHLGLGSVHALKVLDLPYAAIRDRLKLEGQIQAQLTHPNIVAVTDLIEVEGAPGLILEYVPGRSLDAWLRENRPDPATIDALFRQILDGVGFAHRHNLIHRDLKPGNVLLRFVDDRIVPKVSDFGLARSLDGEDGARRTRTGVPMGTPGYMAPEQIRSAKDVDQRADIFALGCILYELWCGAPPFESDSLYDVLVAIEDRAYPPPRTLRGDLPEVVERAIAGCLEPDPERRIPSVQALREVLYPDAAPSEAPASARPPPPPALPALRAEPASEASLPFASAPEPDRPVTPPQPIVRARPAQKPAVRPAVRRSSSNTTGCILAFVIVATAAVGLTMTGMASGTIVALQIMAGLLDTGY